MSCGLVVGYRLKSKPDSFEFGNVNMSGARNGLAFLKQMIKFRTEAKSFENVLQGVSRHL